MTINENEEAEKKLPVEEWLAIRKEAGPKIDPATAEVDWCYGQILDPYDVDPILRQKRDGIGRIYFARSPGSDIWVCFYDLPEALRGALWEKHKSKLAFPAGPIAASGTIPSGSV